MRLIIDKSVRMSTRLTVKLQYILVNRNCIARILGLFIKKGRKDSGIKILLKMEDKQTSNKFDKRIEYNIIDMKSLLVLEQERYIFEDIEVLLQLEEVILGITMTKVSGRYYRVPIYLSEVKRLNLVIKWWYQIFKIKIEKSRNLFFVFENEILFFLKNQEVLLNKKYLHMEDVSRNMTNLRFKR